jgi:hypothetical protein
MRSKSAHKIIRDALNSEQSCKLSLESTGLCCSDSGECEISGRVASATRCGDECRSPVLTPHHTFTRTAIILQERISKYVAECVGESVADARARGWRHRPLVRLSLHASRFLFAGDPPDQISFSSHVALFTNQTRTRAAQPRSSRCGLVARVERRLEACELGYLSLQQPTFRRCCEVRRTTWCHFGLDRTALRSLWYVRARTTDSSWIRNQHAASALSSPLAEIHLRMSENAS